MRPLQVLARLTLVVLMLAQCRVGAQTPTNRVSSWIEGTITDVRDKRPLAGVEIWTESPGSDSYGTTITDQNGHYRIANLQPGSGYYLGVSSATHSRRRFESLTLPVGGLRHDFALARRGRRFT